MIVNKRSFSEWRFETVTFSEQTTRVKTYISRVKTHYTCENMTEIWIIGIRIEWNQISRIDFHSRASEISMCGVLSFFPLFNVPPKFLPSLLCFLFQVCSVVDWTWALISRRLNFRTKTGETVNAANKMRLHPRNVRTIEKSLCKLHDQAGKTSSPCYRVKLYSILFRIPQTRPEKFSLKRLDVWMSELLFSSSLLWKNQGSIAW